MTTTAQTHTTEAATSSNVINLEAARHKRQQALVKLGAKLERMVREARAHPLGLYRLCFTDDRGNAIVLKWFHREWSDLILQNRCVLIEAPRGSTKTTFLVCCVLWFLGHNPDLRIKLVCGNDANAAKRLSEIKSHIEQDNLYKLVFPNVKLDTKLKNDSLTLNLLRTRHTKDATIEAKGVLSDGTGDRSDIVIFDDVCNFKNSVQEPSTRPKVLEKIRGDWLNTLNPRDGRVWGVFTPWHNEDAHSHLKKQTAGRWAYKKYNHGRPNDPFHSIFPELFSSEWLKRKRQEIGSLEYARAYLCQALSGDVQLVRPEWLRLYGPQDITPELLNRATCVLSIDPTGGKGAKPNPKDPDFIGICVALVDDTPDVSIVNGRPTAPHRIYIPEAYQVRLSTAQAAQHVIDLYKRWRPDAVLIEAQGAQSLHEWIYERAAHIPVLPIPATLSKRARLESITPWIEDPRQLILFHPRVVQPEPKAYNVIVESSADQQSATQSEASRTLRNQILDFPTTHDDVLDSFVQSVRYIRQWLLPYENEEANSDLDPSVNPRTPEVNLNVRTIG